MKISKKKLMLLGCIAVFELGVSSLLAQDSGAPGGDGRPGGSRRHFSPQTTMAGLRYQLAVLDDSKWAAVSQKIFVVWDAQRAMIGPGDGPRRRAEGPRDDSFGPESRAEAALRVAVKDNSPDESIKAVLSAVRSAVRAQERVKEEAYLKAQDDLRALLTARQEAQLTLDGVLQ